MNNTTVFLMDWYYIKFAHNAKYL